MQNTAWQNTLGDGAHRRTPPLHLLYSILPHQLATAFLADIWMIPELIPSSEGGQILKKCARAHTHTPCTHARVSREHCRVPENKEAIDTERPFLDI